MVKFFCALVGEAGSAFPVEIDENQSVGELKDAIWNKKRNKLTGDADELQLYLAKKGNAWLSSNDPDVKELKKGEKSDAIKALTHEKKQLEGEYEINHYIAELPQPKTKQIHILVVVPFRDVKAGVRMVDQGWTAKWVNDFRNNQLSQHQLPRLMELTEFIVNELPEKITLHHEIYNDWMTKMASPSRELMDKLFKIDDLKHCVNFLYRIGSRIVFTTDPGDTETSFISFWDDLIRTPLNFVLHDIGKSDRNSSRSASTGSNRPDYLFIVDSVCVFRGEEKAPGVQMETPRRELFEKLDWSYGDVPYLFGYAAVGYEARLYAITRMRDVVDAIELGIYDLKYLEGRFLMLLAILNVARLLRSLASCCPASARDEYKKLIRDNGIRVLLEPSCVVKSLPPALFQQSKDHLEVVYRMLEEHAVPNVDYLDSVDEHAMRFIFTPRGQERKPVNLVELFHALANVLQALVELHAASWMHRDIRWPNVIKHRDDHNSWFLIDFMDAAQSPQRSSKRCHLSREGHAPEIFSDESHTTAVDIWSVGHLIRTCGQEVFRSWYDTGRERTQFLQLLMHDDPCKRPTAVVALHQLRQLEQEYLNSLNGSKKKKRTK